MKSFNINTKRSSLFVKGGTIFFLSVAFIGPKGACKGGGAAGHTVGKMHDEQFDETVKNIEDVSNWTDEKGRSFLYSAVKYCKAEKLKMILKRFAEKKNSGFQHKNEDFINSPDPISHNTPLGEAAIQGNIEIFKILIENEYIDINRKSAERTPLLLAFKYQSKEIANILLKQPTIDIKAQAPNSGNTILHWAIKNQWLDIAKKLIHLLNEQAPDVLFAPNKDGDTPFHFAVAYKLPSMQSKLIEVLPEEKLWIKNNKGQAPVDIAMDNNQTNVIGLLRKAPQDRLYQKHKNDETLLHIAARLNLPDALKLMLGRINELSGKDTVVKQLFEKTKKGESVWDYIYLSQLGLQPVISSSTNTKMFKETISFVKDNLTPEQKDDILQDINERESRYKVKGGISKEYADKLRNALK